MDGRRARGEQRRSELLAATLTVIERDGVAGVSHRAVAAVADVSVASITYHFPTLDDLLVAALRRPRRTWLSSCTVAGASWARDPPTSWRG